MVRPGSWVSLFISISSIFYGWKEGGFSLRFFPIVMNFLCAPENFAASFIYNSRAKLDYVNAYLNSFFFKLYTVFSATSINY